MFAPPSGINHRPGLGLAHPQAQGHGQQQPLHLLHPSSSSAASQLARPKRKISSKPIRASTQKNSSSRSNLPSQESPFVRNLNHVVDTIGGGDGVGGQSNNLMMNHSRQRVPSSMSTLSAFGSHNARSSRAQDRTQQNQSLPYRGQDRSLQQESNTEHQPHYLYSQDLRIQQKGSSRDRLERESLSQQQEHHRPQQPVGLHQHQQPPTSDPLTIRDILDRKELRDQISEMRRSINSNPDDPRRGLSPGQEFDPRLSPEVMAQHERLRKASEANRAGSAFWNPSQRVRPSSYNTRRPAQEDSVVTDLSMDHSLLEQQFREKLDAAIQTTGPTNQEQKVRTQQRNQYTPAAAAVPSLGPANHATTTSLNPGQNTALHRSPSSERRARDLYHSSYSPSEFSQTEDLDNDYSQGDGSKDGKDLNNSTDSRDSGTPTPTGVTVSMTTPRPTPSAIVTLAPSHSRPNPPSSSAPTTRNNEPSRPITAPPKHNTEQENHTADDSGEISFEREVARARAKRELGLSGGQSLNQEHRQESETGKGGPTTPNIRKLDHGRGLALEDLASPTYYGFEAEEAGTEQRGGGGLTRTHFPLLAAATDLARMNIVTEPEDRFMELAGSLGEGQAVASVLGTLKGMIRQLKMEKRTSQSAIRKLQKDLKQSQKELERTRKAKEKLTKSRPNHAAASLNGGLRRSQKSIRHDKNSKTLEQQHVILMEQQENEARAAVIGKEKDLVERNLAKLQKRINALELQRDEVRKRDLRRAEEEADLLFLIKSDSEDDDEDDDDESSSGSSDSESKYRSEPERDEDDDQEEDLGATVRYIGRGGSAVNRPRGVVEERDGQPLPTEKSSSLTKKIPRVDGTNGTLPRRSVRTLEDAPEHSKPSKKSSMSRSSRSKSGQVEEVHVHHHVHYEDEEILEILGIHSKANPPTGQPIRSSRKPASGARLGRVGEELGEQDPLGYPADVHRVHLGTGFRSSRRGSHTEGSDGVHTTSSRDRNAPAADEQHPGRDYKSRSPLVTYRATLLEEYPQRQPLTTVRSLLSSIRGKETRLDDNEEEPRGEQSLASTNGPQKKIAINLPRILSLLKNHDPRRCTVCCDGGSDGQKCTRHRYHEHKVVMAAATSAASTSPSALPPSQAGSRHRALHIGQLPRQKSGAASGPDSVRIIATADLQTEQSSSSSSSESEENAAGVGPTRPVVINDTSASTFAAPQTSTGEAYLLRSSGNGIKTINPPASDLLLKPQEKLQLEVSQIAAEIQFFREYLKRSTLTANTSANGNTSSPTSKAAAASAI